LKLRSFQVISRPAFLQKHNLLYTQFTLENNFSHRISVVFIFKMEAGRLKQIEEIYHAALEIPFAERSIFQTKTHPAILHVSTFKKNRKTQMTLFRSKLRLDR